MAKSRQMSDIDSDLVHRLARLLDETGLSEIEYGRDGWHVRVAKDRAPAATSHNPAPATAPPNAASEPATAAVTTAEDEAVARHPGVITSPMVGVAHTAAQPGDPPFVKEGDAVTRGQVVMLIEAMKVFNSIEAPVGVTVTRSLVAGGTPVDYGEPLLIIE